MAFRYKSNKKPDSQDQQQVVVEPFVNEFDEDDDRWLVCRQCRQKITKPSARVSVNGSHQHTFANPSGIVFEIGCFSLVRGCSGYGPPSTDFAWFTGYSWQITVCSKCLTHLGWLFTSGSTHRFMGLILDRLSETSSKKK